MFLNIVMMLICVLGMVSNLISKDLDRMMPWMILLWVVMVNTKVERIEKCVEEKEKN